MILFKKFLNLTILLVFACNSFYTPLYAGQVVVPLMPKAGVMIGLSQAYEPASLKGIVIHPDNALHIDFLVNKGDAPLNAQDKNNTYNTLIKYFLASLTIPDTDQWVNLSPYEKGRIINDDFGKTEMGRDLLAQDYLLKQITSSLMYPGSVIGKSFWDKVYEEIYKQYSPATPMGGRDLDFQNKIANIGTVDTFNKVWIVPDQAIVYESGHGSVSSPQVTAYVVKSHLKVMLEEDYLSSRVHVAEIQGVGAAPRVHTATQSENRSRSLTSKIIKEIILPELEKEVNVGKNFANLRQIFASMLLATWYKKALKGSLLGKIFADKAKVNGVNNDPKNNEAIYEQYLAAYKKGVYNFIKEEEDRFTHQTIPRKYFAGGAYNDFDKAMNTEHVSDKEITRSIRSKALQLDQVSVALDQAMSSTPSVVISKFEQFMSVVAQPKTLVELKRMGLDRDQISVLLLIFQQAFGLDKQGFNAVMNWINAWNKVDPASLRGIYNLLNKSPKSAFHIIFFSEKKDELHFARNVLFAKVILNNMGGVNSAMRSDILRQMISFINTQIDPLNVLINKRPDQAMLSDRIDLIWVKLYFIDNLFFSADEVQSYKEDFRDLINHYLSLFEEEGLGSAKKQYVEKLKAMRDQFSQEEFARLWPSIKKLAEGSDDKAIMLLGLITRLKIQLEGQGNFEKFWNGGLKDLIQAVNEDRDNLDDGYNELETLVENFEINSSLVGMIGPRFFHIKEIVLDPTRLIKYFPGLIRFVQNGWDYTNKPSYMSMFLDGVEKFEDDVFFKEWQQKVDDLVLKHRSANVPARQTGPKMGNDAMAAMMDNGKYGGIDLNAGHVDIQIKRDGKGVPLPMGQQDLSMFSKIDGFIARIIEIKPVSSLPQFQVQ